MTTLNNLWAVPVRAILLIIVASVLLVLPAAAQSVPQPPVKIENLAPDYEVPPAASYRCFPGGYYRKVASSFDPKWTGIEGTVKLGYPLTDPNRVSAYTGEPLDNFSVYMGGNAAETQEIDAGLTWSYVRDEKGKICKAWKPFWRNEEWREGPMTLYWLPGETVYMSITVTNPGWLRLVISDPGPNPKRCISQEFRADLFMPGVNRQFKRVNAIDQVKNEGKPAKLTNARVTNSTWLETYLLRDVNGQEKRLPMTPQRRTNMECPQERNIEVTADAAQEAVGGETIDIYGMPGAAPPPPPPAVDDRAPFRDVPPPSTGTTPVTSAPAAPAPPAPSPADNQPPFKEIPPPDWR